MQATEAHQGIVRGIVAVASFALLGKVAGALKEMAVAWRFGVSAPVDAYLFVQNLMNWPVAVWFSVLTVVLIPLAGRLASERSQELPRFRAELLAVTLGAGVLLVIAGMVGLPPLLRSDWVGLPPATRALAVHVVPIMALTVLPGLMVGLYSTWLMAGGGHLNTLFEGIPALGILVAVLLFGGIEALVWGTLAGGLVQLAAVGLAAHRREAHGLPAFSLTSPTWAPFRQGFAVMMLGQAVMSVTALVEQFFAARLGEGAISQLGYANRIIALVLGVLATGATRATLPVFARLRASGAGHVRRVALQWAAWLALGAVVLALLGWLLAPWGVRLLFERGTFSRSDTLNVALLLRYGLLQMPFYVASLVLVSLHSSEGRYGLLLMSGVLGLAVKVGASVALLPVLGLPALVLSSTVVSAANAMLLFGARPR